jgi:hypothetical protein
VPIIGGCILALASMEVVVVDKGWWLRLHAPCVCMCAYACMCMCVQPCVPAFWHACMFVRVRVRDRQAEEDQRGGKKVGRGLSKDFAFLCGVGHRCKNASCV